MAEHLNAQQVAQIESKIRLAIEQAINGMNLRKWAVEQALSLPPNAPDDRMGFANSVYDFVCAPLADVKVTIE